MEWRFARHERFPPNGNRTCLGMVFVLYKMKAAFAPDDGARVIVVGRT